MALETPKWMSDALRWRWTPALALVAGSLAYVLLATSLVPTEINFTEKADATGTPLPGLLVPQEPTLEPAPADAAEATAEGATPSRSRRQRRRQALADATPEVPVAPPPPEMPNAEPAPEPPTMP